MVTPSRIRLFRRLAALANSSSSLAARVARTVLAMPPPLRGDFRVADALQALFEFTAAVAAEHRVGVAVDQARA